MITLTWFFELYFQNISGCILIIFPLGLSYCSFVNLCYLCCVCALHTLCNQCCCCFPYYLHVNLCAQIIGCCSLPRPVLPLLCFPSLSLCYAAACCSDLSRYRRRRPGLVVGCTQRLRPTNPSTAATDPASPRPRTAPLPAVRAHALVPRRRTLRATQAAKARARAC